MAVRATPSPGAQQVPRAPQAGAGWWRRQSTTALTSLVIGGGLAYIYATYLRSDDVSPDSIYGYGFAIAGTLLLVLVGAGYALRKRRRRNWSGLLHTALTWHVVGGLFGLLLILMHAAGNFHPRTGTYALWGLIALVVSGIIGRQLDRVAPRLAARAALATLTTDGEERLEVLVDALHVKRRSRRDKRSRPLQEADTSIPWDLAYYDLGAQANEIPTLLKQGATGGPRRMTGRPGDAADVAAGATATAKSALVSESAHIRRAIGRERLFLQLVRAWRWVHTLISLVTLGLILWHLEYAAVLLMNAH